MTSRGPETSQFQGRYFEDFVVGDIYYHPMGKTVTQMDNQLYTLATQNTAKTHVDVNYAAQTEYGLPLVNSLFTLSLVMGQTTLDLSFNVYANLGWDEVRLPNPVFEGDTIYSRSKVLSVRESKSKPSVGIVRVASEGYNQNGTIVITFQRNFMVYKHGFGPNLESIRPDEASLPAID
jgi:itaconyl-CoA hydratase